MALNYSSIDDDGAFSFRNLERFEVLNTDFYHIILEYHVLYFSLCY